MVSADDPRERLHALLRARSEDPRVLAALLETPRDLYVPEAARAHAWDDRALPLAGGQTISQPTMVAIMIEALVPQGPPGPGEPLP